ncbi:GNAT family N-acetyltransferase [Bacillus toyonensis]
MEVKRQTSEKNNIQSKTKQEHKPSQNAIVHFTNDFASNLELIKQQIGHNSDVRFRKFNIGRTDIQAGIVFVDGLSDKEIIDKHIMKLLMDDFSDEYKNETSYVEGTVSKEYIKNKVIQYNMSILTDEARQTMEEVSLVVKNEEGKIFGGVTGTMYFYHLHIDFLWVDESVRHDGYGSQLLHEIEGIAKEKGCRLILLDSFSFQAPEFYKKHGYREYGVVEDHPKGHSQHFFEKRL